MDENRQPLDVRRRILQAGYELQFVPAAQFRQEEILLLALRFHEANFHLSNLAQPLRPVETNPFFPL